MADSISKYNVDPADDNNLNLNQNEQHDQHSFVINEENICSNFGLKEEIAAQSLILSALSGQLQEDAAASRSNSLPSSESQTSEFIAARVVKNACEETQNYLQNENDLAFQVSPDVGVQLIAIQQSVESETETATSNISENVDLVHHHQSSVYLENNKHLDNQNQVESVVNLNIINSCDGVKTEIDEESGNESHSTQGTIEEQIVKQLQVDLEAAARHSDEADNFAVSETIKTPNYAVQPGASDLDLLLDNGNAVNSSHLFVAGSADESHAIIKRYAEETMSTFVSMRKMKQFGITEGGIDLKKKNYRVFFESCDVEFDGIPYIYVADKMYICHLGKDKTEVTRQKIRQQSMEKRLKMGLPIKDCSASRLRTKKIDCPVKITVKMIAKFPQFQVLRKTKRVCETASKRVRQALTETNGNLRCYYSFVGKLPSVTEHNHPVGEETTANEPIDPLIKDKIIQLTWEGVQSSNELRKQLDEYVEHELFAGKLCPPKTRRRYYPNVKDIRNYMNKAKMLSRFSPDIRNELDSLYQKFQTLHPNENFVMKSNSNEPTREAMLNIKQCDDEPTPKSTLIFCYQTSQQQRLLKRYGNQFVICEVTNLIERVPFPTFGLFVQTNVDYQLGALFIVEVRNKDSIIEGLSSIKEWNPGWAPKYVTVDYSDEQMEAVAEVFPGSSQFISDTSRERSWCQWLSIENEVNGNMEQVFGQFQAIANAYNEEELHNAALQLENSEVWAKAPSLRSWFNSNWLLEAKKWVAGYRPDDFFITSHNDVPMEDDVKSLRDLHISFMRSRKLSSLIEHLVEKIVPDFYRRYVDLNHKSYIQANELKVLYDDQFPTCLTNKPSAVIMYVLNQMKSTETTVYQVSHVHPGVFWVQDATPTSSNARPHTVSFGDAVNLPSCDCADWQRYKLPCKHLCSVFSSFSDWGWDMLNATYTSNSLINLDYSCIKPWIQIYEKNGEECKDGTEDVKPIPHHHDHANMASVTVGTNSTEQGVSYSTEQGSTDLTGTIPREKIILESDSNLTVDDAICPEAGTIVTKEENMDDGNEVFILNVNTDDIPLLGALTDDRRNELAVQCRILLQNLTQLPPSVVIDESLERLKSDLETSINVLKIEPGDGGGDPRLEPGGEPNLKPDMKPDNSINPSSSSVDPLSNVSTTTTTERETINLLTDCKFTSSSTSSNSSGLSKRCLPIDHNINNSNNNKRSKLDGNAMTSLESFVSTSRVSNTGDVVVATEDREKEMEEQTVETVEIITENDSDGSAMLNDDVTRAGEGERGSIDRYSSTECSIRLVSNDRSRDDHSREQRERQLLNILTASSS